ncbi:MFS transporter [Salininema proteolyticum]|uniref:MFS transporter n=1 Tax=Salininema proteolyticum TaxID=1607685 RepID=A0ABV8U4G7_9ACTN
MRQSAFRRFFAAGVFGSIGQRMWLFAVPLAAIGPLGASAFQVGLLTALANAAVVAFSLPLGVWIDRSAPRRRLIASGLVRAAVVVSVPLAWWADALSYWHLAAVVFASGALDLLYQTSRQSLLPPLVGRPRLVEANARLEAVNQTTSLGGPALAGQMVAILSTPVTMLAGAVSMAASSIAVAAIPASAADTDEKPDGRGDAASRSFRRDMAEGMRFVLGEPVLRVLASSNLLANSAVFMFGSVQVYYLAHSLGMGPGQIGVLLSAGGAGGVAGAFTARKIAARLGQGPAMAAALVLFAPCSAMLPLTTGASTAALGGAGLAGMMFFAVVYNVAQVSTRQAITPPRLLGRVNATFRFATGIMAVAGALVGGAIAEAVDARTALWTSTALGFTACLPVLLSPVRRLRQLP